MNITCKHEERIVLPLYSHLNPPYLDLNSSNYMTCLLGQVEFYIKQFFEKKSKLINRIILTIHYLDNHFNTIAQVVHSKNFSESIDDLGYIILKTNTFRLTSFAK